MTQQFHPRIHTLKNWKEVLKTLYTNVHSSTIHHSKKVETQMSISRWVDKQHAVSPRTMEYYLVIKCNKILTWILKIWCYVKEVTHQKPNVRLSGKESACQCRGHRFNPWSKKIPHAKEQLSPCAPQLLSLCSRVQVPHLLKPVCPRTHALQQEKPLQWEAHACCN